MSLKKIGSILSGIIQLILLVLILTAVTVALLSRPEGLYDYRAFVLSSGSMTPTMSVNSLVIVKPQSSYQKDDVITFYTNDQNGVRQKLPTTHRVFSVKEGENTGYETKGDANNTPDPNITPAKSVIGKVVFHLPYFGSFSDFAKSRNGLTYLIVIPASIIAYQEIINIKNEIAKILATRKLKSSSANLSVETHHDASLPSKKSLPQKNIKPKSKIRPKSKKPTKSKS